MDEKLRLAESLLAEARRPQPDAATQFALLHLACDLCAAAGNYVSAVRVIEQLAETFDIAPLVKKADVLLEISRGLKTPEQKRALTGAALDLIAAAVLLNDYETAERVCRLAVTATRAAKNRDLSDKVKRRCKDVAELAKRFEKVRPFAERLKEVPDDRDANLALGQFECVFKRNWKRGLTHLAAGSDDSLRILAERDLENPIEPERCRQLADDWYTLAQGNEPNSKVSFRVRALYWYELCWPGLVDLDQQKIEQRIAEIQRDAGVATRPLRWLEQLGLGFEHEDQIDCSKAVRSFELASTFDLGKSWVLSLEFQAPDIRKQGQLLLIGDERPGSDPLYVCLNGDGLLRVAICDSSDPQKGFRLEVPLDPKDATHWKRLRVTYREKDHSVVVDLDNRQVNKASIPFSPKIDRPMPLWIGGASVEWQRFFGKVRRVSLTN